MPTTATVIKDYRAGMLAVAVNGKVAVATHTGSSWTVDSDQPLTADERDAVTTAARNHR